MSFVKRKRRLLKRPLFSIKFTQRTHSREWEVFHTCILLYISNQINIYELISVCLWTQNVWMISETTYISQTKLIGQSLPIGEHGIGYSILTPDPQGARGAPGVKIQVSPNQKTSLTKVVRHDKGMIKMSSAPPEELGKPAKRVS